MDERQPEVREPDAPAQLATDEVEDLDLQDKEAENVVGGVQSIQWGGGGKPSE
jgi:hypothetical protein